MDKVNLTIDDVPVATKAGTTILQAAREVGIYIPTLCSRPDLPLPLGECRLCVVRVEGQGFPSSCITPVAIGMNIKTNTPQVQEVRRHILKALLSSLPSPRLKRPELKKIASYIGVTEESLPPYVSRNLPVDNNEPLFQLDHNRCILCGLCIRICNEVRGVKAIDFVIRDGRTMVGPSHGSSLKEAGCKFCGACVEVCPTGALIDKDGELPEREAGIPSCTYACPAGVDVPCYVYLITQRRFAEAAAVIREKVPFPGVLGRICPHPCEEKCRRGQINEPISIGALKRVCAERDAQIWRVKSSVAKCTGKRVAIVGSGPTGLTAGFYLAKLGHSVTIFEALPEIGGMMRVGIPEYRLPRTVLTPEIEQIRRVGVEIKTDTRVENIEKLLKGGFSAVLLAVGAHRSLKLDVPGRNMKGIVEAVSLLRDVNLGREIKLHGKVGVIGGGSVAIDAARTALRLGAKNVQLICLESREEMPAYEDEIRQAIDEGVIINCSWGVKRILGNSNGVSGIDCIRCASVFDDEGKFNPTYIEAEKKSFEVDVLVVAIGQAPDLSFLRKGSRVQSTSAGTIKVNKSNLETDMDGVFAAGDAESGPGTVVEAITAGRKAAAAIDKHLGGSGIIDEKLVEIEEPSPWLGPGDGFVDIGSVQMPYLPPKQRLSGFAEVELGLSEAMAIREANRCLRCQLRIQIPLITTPPVH